MKRAVLIFLAISLIFLSACSKSEKKAENTTSEPATEVPMKVNYLTGEEREFPEATVPRPVAVMVNNLEAALPQYGISRADIIMEMPVEGGITRLMALYSDYRDVPSVCSVRSCRYYFPIFAKGFDAVYFCYGSNELLGTPTLEKTGIAYIDGNKQNDSLVFERDRDRLEVYSPEHTVYLKGDNMEDVFEKYGFRKELSPSYKNTAFEFSDEKQKFSFECTGITGSFSSSYSSDFFFDSESQAYKKTHNGEKHLDAKTATQLEFTNVFLLKTDVSKYKDTNLLEIEWHSGDGYYVTMGSVEEISWKKQSESAPLEFFDLSGKPLKVNKGKSYIGIGVDEVIISRDSSPEY